MKSSIESIYPPPPPPPPDSDLCKFRSPWVRFPTWFFFLLQERVFNINDSFSHHLIAHKPICLSYHLPCGFFFFCKMATLNRKLKRKLLVVFENVVFRYISLQISTITETSLMLSCSKLAFPVPTPFCTCDWIGGEHANSFGLELRKARMCLAQLMYAT